MDWDHFSSGESGKFKLKRLPAIRKPIRITDVTDLEDLKDDFKGLDFEEGLSRYEFEFDDGLNYDLEIEDITDAIARMSADILGPLKALKEYPQSIVSFYYFSASDSGIKIPHDIALKAEKAGLIEKDGSKYFRPSARLPREIQEFANRVVGAIRDQLEEYPQCYQRKVWEEVATYLEPEELFSQTIKRLGGREARRALDAETEDEITERLMRELEESGVDMEKIRGETGDLNSMKLSIPKQIAAGLVAAIVLVGLIQLVF